MPVFDSESCEGPAGNPAAVPAPNRVASGRVRSRKPGDCERMGCIDSSGLRALMVGARACRWRGGKLVIAALLP